MFRRGGDPVPPVPDAAPHQPRPVVSPPGHRPGSFPGEKGNPNIQQEALMAQTAGNRAPEYGATPQTDTAVEARQGVTGHNVNIVLIVSTVAVVIAFAVIYAAFFSA